MATGVNKGPDGRRFKSSNLSSISWTRLRSCHHLGDRDWSIGLNCASVVKMFSRCRMQLKNRFVNRRRGDAVSPLMRNTCRASALQRKLRS